MSGPLLSVRMSGSSLVRWLVLLSFIASACTASVAVESDTVSGGAGAFAQPTVEVGDPVAEPTPEPETEAPATITSGELGADNPAAAVEIFVAAANNGDPLGILSVIVPAERNLLGGLYDRTLTGVEAEWPQFGGQSSVTALMPEVIVDGELTVEELSPYLAYVSAEKIEAWLDNPTDPLASLFWSNGVWGPNDERQPSLKADSFSDFYDDLPSGVPLGVVTVQIDGRWYISFARSGMEGMRRGAEVAAVFPAEPPTIARVAAADPLEAVRNFAAALQVGSLDAIASALAPGEAAAIADYVPSMGDWVLTATQELQIGAALDSATVVSADGTSAIVELNMWEFSVIGDFEDEMRLYEASFEMTLEVDDGVCSLTTVFGDRTSGCHPYTSEDANWATLPFMEGWQGFRIATVQVGDQWVVSLYDTAALWLNPYTQQPLFAIYNAPGLSDAAQAILMNEKARSLPLSDSSGLVDLTLVADGRLGLARVIPAEGETRMWLRFSSSPPRECGVGFWNTDTVSTDWARNESPEHFAVATCEEALDGGLPVVPGVEIAVLAGGSGDGPFTGVALEFGS